MIANHNSDSARSVITLPKLIFVLHHSITVELYMFNNCACVEEEKTIGAKQKSEAEPNRHWLITENQMLKGISIFLKGFSIFFISIFPQKRMLQ